MGQFDPLLDRTRTAYFPMEIALRPEIHNYGGRLGMVAGDTARSCANLEMTLVFVAPISRAGFLRQEISREGRQVDLADPSDPTLSRPRRSAPGRGRDRDARSLDAALLYQLKGGTGYEVPVLLLDTALDENASEDQRLTDR
jgi:glycogen phosphorylase